MFRRYLLTQPLPPQVGMLKFVIKRARNFVSNSFELYLDLQNRGKDANVFVMSGSHNKFTSKYEIGMPINEMNDQEVIGKLKKHAQQYSLSQKISTDGGIDLTAQLLQANFSYRMFNDAVGRLRRIEVFTPDIVIEAEGEESQRFEYQEHTGS